MTDLIATLQAAAGNAAGEALYVEDVFSTYLYEGTSSARSITNGIDLDGEGGLVWIKNRGVGSSHRLYDTNRGVHKDLRSDQNFAENTDSTQLTAFNSNGFSLGADAGGLTNYTTHTYASWTFRKAPKFFDVVTYTGNGVGGRQINHNLGSVPGMVIVKNTSAGGDWRVWHRAIPGDTNDTGLLVLNSTQERENNKTNIWAANGMTDSYFTVSTTSPNNLNESGQSYVAYFFAHNDGDGEFGEDADQDIIKGGSYTGVGSGAVDVDLGFEPQFVLIKNASRSADWTLQDTMRGMSHTDWNLLVANKSQAELDISADRVVPTATGFTVNNNGSSDYGLSGDTVIYIAIRRGPMKTPEDATEVFAVDTYTGNDTNGRLISSGFPVDSAIIDPRNGYSTPGGPNWFSRLTGNGKFLTTAATTAELDGSSNSNGVLGQDGITVSRTGTNVWSNVSPNTYVSWFLRRAPGFFDVVAYPGSSSAKTVGHNLGVTPEMIIFKNRTDAINWIVYHKDTGSDSSVDVTELDTSDALRTSTAFFNSTQPTDSVFTVGTASHTNFNGRDYIAYLFATLPGVSKVGSYTGNGTSQTIDCGFSAGARFVLTKRTNTTGNWNVWDSERGIVAGNDPRLELNTTDAEDTGHDYIDPDNSGFIVNYVADDDDDSNVSGDTYIFLAIA